MLLRWPDRIRAGQVNDEDMVRNIDVAPTLLDLAGLTPPDWMQGRSWEPLLEGKDVDWREDFLYEWFEYPGVHCARKPRGVRTGRWSSEENTSEPQSLMSTTYAAFCWK